MQVWSAFCPRFLADNSSSLLWRLCELILNRFCRGGAAKRSSQSAVGGTRIEGRSCRVVRRRRCAALVKCDQILRGKARSMCAGSLFTHRGAVNAKCGRHTANKPPSRLALPTVLSEGSTCSSGCRRALFICRVYLSHLDYTYFR